jgi:hypothetical protein
VRSQADKKVMAKDLLGPMAGEGGEIISSEPKVIAIGFAPALIAFGRRPRFRRDLEAREAAVLAGIRAGGKPRMERALEGGREDGSGMTFAGPKKRGSQRAKLSTRVDSAWDEAVALVKDVCYVNCSGT